MISCKLVSKSNNGTSFFNFLTFNSYGSINHYVINHLLSFTNLLITNNRTLIVVTGTLQLT